MKKRNLIERMEAEGVLCAEGFLFEMERRGYLASGEFVPEVALECPDAFYTKIFNTPALILWKLSPTMGP